MRLFYHSVDQPSVGCYLYYGFMYLDLRNWVTIVKFLIERSKNISQLTIFIVLSTFLIMVLSMLFAGLLFYSQSADALTGIYREEIVQSLEQINQRVHDQVALVDSVYTLLASNTIIRGNLDPASEEYGHKSFQERRLEIERQLGYMLVNNYLWNEQLINGVYIFDSGGVYSSFSTYDLSGAAVLYATEVTLECDQAAPSIQIRMRKNSDASLYFVKNIMSVYTGRKIAQIVVDLKRQEWMSRYSAGTDENWLILLYNHDLLLSLGTDADNSEMIDAVLAASKAQAGFQESYVQATEYFVASKAIGTAGLVSVVAAPKSYLLRDLNKTLSSYIRNYALIALATMILTVFASLLATSPIKQMIGYVRDVSVHRTAAKRPKARFRELDEFLDAFSEMLAELEQYYKDLHEQQLLLKNAEIKALQAQINPHFLFNILNTIAWKAEMGDNSEVYRMVLSLGELLRANTLAKDRDFVTLKEELDYVQYYLFLQQQRFDGDISVEIDCQGVPEHTLVPRLSIQPLVENAVLHGFEPLPDDERNWQLIIRVLPEADGIRIRVEDNGAGFPDDFDLECLTPSHTDRDTHIALKNLNQRLMLLGGAENRLTIDRACQNTVISFWLPGREGDE